MEFMVVDTFSPMSAVRHRQQRHLVEAANLLQTEFIVMEIERLIEVADADHRLEIFHALRLPSEFRFRVISGMIRQSAVNVKAGEG